MVLAETNEELTAEAVEKIRQAGLESFRVLYIDNVNVGPYLRSTLLADKIKTMENAIMEIYRRLRPGDPPTYETALAFFDNLFLSCNRNVCMKSWAQ